MLYSVLIQIVWIYQYRQYLLWFLKWWWSIGIWQGSISFRFRCPILIERVLILRLIRDRDTGGVL
jgi:hypothetical protein